MFLIRGNFDLLLFYTQNSFHVIYCSLFSCVMCFLVFYVHNLYIYYWFFHLISFFLVIMCISPQFSSLQDGFAIPMATVAQIQNVLLIVMSNMARGLFRHKPVCMGHLESNCFVDAAMAFCKLQHAITSIPVKTQVSLFPL